MSQANMDKTVQDFLKKIKEKLPEWLKDKKGELKDVLSEIEEHIWDKAEELSDIGTPTESSVRLALAHMGPPESIAKEYKRRGTPKVYISEELWPIYTRVLGILFAIVFMVNMVFMIINLATGNFQLDLVEILLGFTGVFTIITLIFVGLSMEGYLPEDFKSEEERKREEKELSIAESKGWPISPDTGKPLKPFIKPGEEIVGGGIGLIFGIVLLTLPFPTYMLLPDFIAILRVFGLLTMLECSLDIARGIIGNRRPSTHQVLHAIAIPLKLSVIPLLGVLLNRPEIFPWFSEPWIHVGIPVEGYGLYRGIMVLIIVITCLTTLEDLYKIVKIQKYK